MNFVKNIRLKRCNDFNIFRKMPLSNFSIKLQNILFNNFF